MNKNILLTLITGICFQATTMQAMQDLSKLTKYQLNNRLAAQACVGDLLTIKELLASGASVATSDAQGDTPLHWAVYRRMPELIVTLIEAGADINAKNKKNLTAFQEVINFSTTSHEFQLAALKALLTTVTPKELGTVKLTPYEISLSTSALVKAKLSQAAQLITTTKNQYLLEKICYDTLEFHKLVQESCCRLLAKPQQKHNQ